VTRTVHKTRSALRTVAPADWSMDAANEVAAMAARLIVEERETGFDPDTGALEFVREFSADDWDRARGIFDPRAREHRLAAMARAEALAQHHEEHEFDLVAVALDDIAEEDEYSAPTPEVQS